jgi:hypothetical protein
MTSRPARERTTTQVRRRWFWLSALVLVALLAVTAVVVVRGRDRPPSLVPADAIPGMTLERQDEMYAYAPGSTWCSDIAPGRFVWSPVTGSRFDGDGVAAGAMFLNLSVRGRDSAAIIGALEAGAAACALRLVPGQNRQTIEPLAGLPEGAVGWRTTRERRSWWGEIAAIPWDEDRVLVVGIESYRGGDVPIDVRDLLAMALEGAEQFPADAG